MKILLPFLPLRALLVSVVAMLVAVALFFAVGDLLQNRTNYQHEKSLVEDLNLSNRCVQVLSHFAVERAQTNLVLLTRKPISAANQSYLTERRKIADAQIQDLFLRLPQNWRTQIVSIKESWEEFRRLTVDFDKDIILPEAKQNVLLRWQWKAALNDLVSKLESLSAELSGDFDFNGEISPEKTERVLAQLSTMVSRFKKLVNAEARLLSDELFVGQTLSQETIATLKEIRLNAVAFWSEIDQGAIYLSSLNADLNSSFIGIREVMFSRFFPIQDKVIHNAAAGQFVGADIEKYSRTLAAASESLSLLESSIGSAEINYAAERFNIAERRALISLCLIVIVIIISVFLQVLLTGRFTRPLNLIMSHIAKLKVWQDSLGHSTSTLPVRGDEFTHVQQALNELEAAIEAKSNVEEALRKSLQVNTSILACAPMAIMATDAKGQITVFSPGAESLFGYQASDVIGESSLLLLIDPEELHERAKKLSEAVGDTFEPNFNFFRTLSKFDSSLMGVSPWVLIKKDGGRLRCLLSFAILDDKNAEAQGYLAIATDVSERFKIEQKLHQSAQEIEKQHSLLQALVQTAPIGIYMVEVPSRKALFANDFALKLVGLASKDDDLAAHKAFKLSTKALYPEEESPWSRAVLGQPFRLDDFLVVLPNRTERILEITGMPVRDNENTPWACVMCLVDITERSHQTAEMSRQANFDFLTQLPNRRLFNDRLQVALSQAKREQRKLALMSIDLDKFKPVNDTYGHAVGDDLLQKVATRMQNVLRESDTLARVGGDEFAVILPNINNAQGAELIGEKIRLSLNEPFVLEGDLTVSIACCIGVAIYPEHGSDEKTLNENADSAMYLVKNSGRNQVRLFQCKTTDEEMNLGYALVPLKWIALYDSGFSPIDVEHQALFEQVNQLIEAHLSGVSTEQLHVLMDETTIGVHTHFSNEEKILAELNYPHLDEHVERHQQCLTRIKELNKRVKSSQYPIQSWIAYVANDVVKEHLFKEDRKFFSWLEKVTSNKSHSANN